MIAAAVRTEAAAAVRRSQREFRRGTSPPASTAISVGNEQHRHPNSVDELYIVVPSPGRRTNGLFIRRYSLFPPLLLALVTLVLWFGFQTSQLLTERDNLKSLRTNQDAIYGNAQKMRAQLDAIAAGTARLAQQGNANAAQVVNALRARGITINPDAQKTAQPVGK